MNQCVYCGDYSEEIETVLVADSNQAGDYEEHNVCPECLDTLRSDPDYDVVLNNVDR